MKPISAIIIGVGDRGGRYARCMAELPEQFQVKAIAESVESRREMIRQMFGIGDDAFYPGWEEILAQPKMADLAIIATRDDMHFAPAMAAIEKGYSILLEKPVAPTAWECKQIAMAAKRKGVKVLVCHVLRYTDFYGTVKKLIMEGTIGEVVSLSMTEGIGHLHFAHSYVRGNWHNEASSSPMLLAKCCHDLDIAQWLVDKPCLRVQSFGGLTHFTEKNAPAGSPYRCADGGCPAAETCPYNCMKFYYDIKDNFRRINITNGISKTTEPTDEEVLQALKTTNYGLCVYHTDNDVADHQVVNMELEGGVTATLTVNAFNEGGRHIRVYGTKGELYANMSDEEITIFTFADKKRWTVPVKKTLESIAGGHGGGDAGIIRELHAYMSGNYHGFRAADIQISVENHMIGFAAEQARHTNTVVDIAQFCKELEA